MYLHTKINASEKAKPNLTTPAQLSGRGLDEKMFQGINILFVQQSPGLTIASIFFSLSRILALQCEVRYCIKWIGVGSGLLESMWKKEIYHVHVFIYSGDMQRHKSMVPSSMLCNTIYLKMENAQS